MLKGRSKQIVIGLVAGEVSGDILGANLISALKKYYPEARFVGIAGPRMQQQGCEAWFEMNELAVMGLVEIIGRLGRILRIRSQVKRRMITLQPDIFIGIDAPDFNLSLEFALKKKGIKVVHYVSPSVWAWRQRRVIKIKASVDNLLAFLPFEKDFYDNYGVPCQFVGHTMADKIPLFPDRDEQRRQLKLAEKGYYISLLPGSRISELTQLSKDFLLTAQQLKQCCPQVEFLVPLADEAHRTYFEQIHQAVAPNLALTIYIGQARQAMMASNVALLASGTAALECMLVKCPMVVAYKVNALTYFFAKRLIKTRFISLPNLLANCELVEEFLQSKCTPEQLVFALQKLIESPDNNKALIDRFTQLHQQIRCNADEQAALAIAKLIQ